MKAEKRAQRLLDEQMQLRDKHTRHREVERSVNQQEEDGYGYQ